MKMEPISPTPDFDRAHQILRSALQPAPRIELAKAITAMGMLTANKAGDEVSLDLRLEAYVQKLSGYPADVALSAVNGWSEKSKWWPAWAELREECENLMIQRRQMLAALEYEEPAIESEPSEEDKTFIANGLKSLAKVFRFGRNREVEKAA